MVFARSVRDERSLEQDRGHGRPREHVEAGPPDTQVGHVGVTRESDASVARWSKVASRSE